MAIAKMKLVNIVGLTKDFDSVVRSCCVDGDFHPEQSSLALEGMNMNEFVPIDEPNPFAKTLQRALDIGVHSNVHFRYSSFDKLGMSVEQIEQYIEKTESELGVLNGRVREFTQSVARLQQGLTQLQHLKSLDISLEELTSCKFFSFRFGRLPKDSLAKLEVCEESENVFFFTLEEDKDYFWGYYVALKSEADKMEDLFSSLYFEHIELLDDASGTPADSIPLITKRLESENAKLESAQKDVEKYWKEHEDTFLRVYSHIKYLSDSFDLRKYAAKHEESFYIFGWVPERKVSQFVKKFDRFDGVDCIVESTEEAENVQPPTHLINNRVLRPFASFVGMYGLPTYNEMDPTPFLAVTYIIFFGIMFADLGQGLLIFLGGLILSHRNKNSQILRVLTRIGLASAVVGALCNSFFGFENVLPVTILPLHEDKYMNDVLIGAIALGVFLILLCMVFNIINGIRQHKPGKVFFSSNGLAGMVFYVSLLLAAVMMVVFNKNLFNPLFIIVFLVIPLIFIFMSEPLSKLVQKQKNWLPEKKGEYAVTGGFGLFETLLSYVTNTISFVRVGAFVLSHAGMMAAVFTFAKMGPQLFGNDPIVLLIGNAFVIGLEGLVVGIQCLRLEFYELFSRFYDGNGKPFEPVTIKYDNN